MLSWCRADKNSISPPLKTAKVKSDNDKANEAAVKTLLEDCDAFFFDCDGTLYHAGDLIPHVAEAINFLRNLGKKLFFVTNTSSRSREQLCSKLQKLGVPCEASECVPSCVFTADYIHRMHPEAKHVYVVGGQGVQDELAKVGITSSGGPAEDKEAFSDEEFKALGEKVKKERFDGVVSGWDLGFSFYKLAKASLVFQNHPECFFYATNDDAADKVGGFLLPGNGPLLKNLEASCAACAPDRIGKEKPFGAEAVVLGKPNPNYAKLIAEWNGLDLQRSVMVGDRLDTDILMGVNAGMKSLFVLTGVDDVTAITTKKIQPDFTLPSVGCLYDYRPNDQSNL